jgi:hypothetical protein
MTFPPLHRTLLPLGTIILGGYNTANKKGGNQVPPFLDLTL